MMGAVIMKMISSTNATSTSEVTLMSALSGNSPCPRSPPAPGPPRRPAILQPAFARHRTDQLLRKSFELSREQSETIHEEVVRHDRGYGDGEAAYGRDQCFGHARRHGRDVAGS